jgi:hypothetical protein
LKAALSESIKEAIITVNFITTYEIVISRVVIKEAGKREEKMEDTVVSCYPHLNQ